MYRAWLWLVTVKNILEVEGKKKEIKKKRKDGGGKWERKWSIGGRIGHRQKVGDFLLCRLFSEGISSTE